MRYKILCFLIFIIILLLGLKSYETWNQPFEIIPEKGVVKKAETKPEMSQITGNPKNLPPLESIILISEKNIFNPERKDFPIPIFPPGGEPPKKPVARPQVILYGLTIAEDYQSATIANPGRPIKKGEKEMMTLKVGGQVGEYRLAKILPDRIMLEAAEDSFEVLLYDPKMPKKRIDVKTEVKPATVTTISPIPPLPQITEAPKPTTPREPTLERVAPPQPPPMTPPIIPPAPRRGGSPFYPPSGVQPRGVPLPVAPTQELGEI